MSSLPLAASSPLTSSPLPEEVEEVEMMPIMKLEDAVSVRKFNGLEFLVAAFEDIGLELSDRVAQDVKRARTVEEKKRKEEDRSMGVKRKEREMPKELERKGRPVGISRSMKVAPRMTMFQDMMHRMEQAGNPESNGPIILVPSSSISKGRINLKNVAQFLTASKFEDPSVPPLASSMKPATPVRFSHRLCGRDLVFRVFDSVEGFRKNDWLNLLCVFVHGKKWQLSGFPFQSYADCFQSIKGVHVRYADEGQELSVSDWNVQVYSVQKHTRYGDASVVHDFWRALESFVGVPRTRKFDNKARLP